MIVTADRVDEERVLVDVAGAPVEHTARADRDAGLAAGDAESVPAACADLDGRLRVWDGDGNGSRIVDMGAYEFGSPLMGDLNCDGAVNALDIEPFILALLDPPAYAAAHPACDIALADVDCSGVADPSDIGPLVQLLLGP